MQIVYRVLNKFLLHLRIFELGSYSSKRKFQRFTSFVFSLYVCLFLKKDRCFISLNDPCHLFIFVFFWTTPCSQKKFVRSEKPCPSLDLVHTECSDIFYEYMQYTESSGDFFYELFMKYYCNCRIWFKSSFNYKIYIPGLN